MASFLIRQASSESEENKNDAVFSIPTDTDAA